MSANREDRVDFVVNAAGRRVPTIVNGQPARPYAGIGAPAPDGPFYLVMRLYGPGDEIRDETWRMPAIERVE